MIRRIWLVALALIVTVSTWAGSGGPDAFGYTWKDSAEPGGPTYSWIEISGTGVDLDLIDEELSTTQALGFQFNYYGTNYDEIKVSSNGWITFNTAETASSSYNYPIPDANGPTLMIAPLWDDLDPPTLPGEVYFQDFGTYAVIQWDDVEKYLGLTYHTFEVILYDSGVIRFQYQTVGTDTDDCTVGIEDGTEADGLQCLYNNTASGGFSLADGYAVEFTYGTPVLVCTSATALPCGATLTNITSSHSDAVTGYGCNANTYDGDEEVFELTLATMQNVDVTLSNFGSERVDVFLLGGCDELRTCLAWGDTALSYDRLPAGTHYIVVDGERNGDTGPYDLALECNPTSTLNCSSSCSSTLYSEDFSGGLPGTWTVTHNGACTGAAQTWTDANPGARTPVTPIASPFMIVDSDEAGSCAMNERLQSPVIDCTAGGPYTEIHLRFDHHFDWYSLGQDEHGDVLVTSTLAGGWQTVASYHGADSPNPQSADIDVTAYALAQTDFRVRFRYYNANYEMFWMVDNVEVCGVAAGASPDCSSAQSLTCPYSATDTTAGGPSTFDAFACSDDTFAGHEKIYSITVGGPTTLGATLSSFGSRDLSLFLLSSCDPCACVAGGISIDETVPSGTYYLVVDGFTAADDGTFDLEVTCADPCAAPPAITCGTPVTSTTVGAGDDLHDPGLTCVGGGAGPDEIFRLTTSGPVGSTILAEATPTGGWDHVLYALSNCLDVTSCLAGADSGPITVDTTTDPQSVFLVVDGYAAGSQGAYSLTAQCFSNQLACGSAEPVGCYDVKSVNTAGGPQDVYKYGCAASGGHPGPERVYSIATTSVGTLSATLSGISGDDLDVFILDATCSPAGAACLAWGETAASVAAAPPGTYYIVVDTDKIGGAGTGTLTVTCPLGNGIACGAAVDIACNAEVDGDTSSGTSGQARYSCAGADLQGKELVYRITLASQRYLRATFSGTGGRNLDMVLLSACDPNACLTRADAEFTRLTDAGTYYLIVDGSSALDDGAFHLELLCIEPASAACATTLIDEDFEGAAPPWTTEVISGNAWDLYTDSLYSCGGTDFMRYPFHDTEDADSWVFTDGKALSAAAGYTLQFDWRVRSATFPESASVWLGTLDDSGSMTTQLWSVTDSTSTTCGTPSLPFTVPVDGTYHLGFHCTSDADMYWFIVDDLLLTGTGGATNPNCATATAIGCGQTLTGQSMGAAEIASAYSCSSYAFHGRERVYTFTLTETRTVDAALSNFGTEDLTLFLLGSCDVCDCLQAGGTSVHGFALSPGTYYLVVEGFDASDDDATFDLSLTCENPCLNIPLLSCNTPVSGDTSDDTNLVDPTCGTGGAGPEEMWKLFFDGPVGSELVVSLPTPSWDHILYALTSCLDGTSCVGWVDSGNLTLTTTASPQTFYIAVDGYSTTAEGAYSNLMVTCPIPTHLNCAAATAVSCGATMAGDTIGQANLQQEYASVSGTYAGSEIVHALTIASPKNLDIYLEGHPGRTMDLILLEMGACDVNRVLEGGVGQIHRNGAAAGTYYLIVDGRTPADNGAFSLRIVCNDPATVVDCGSNYTADEVNAYSWLDATGGTALTLGDDANSGFIALPFPFDYFGTVYNQVALCSNGWASFTDATSTAYGNLSVPSATAPNALLAAFWDDLDPSLGGTVYHATLGSAPNRTFVVQWDAVRHHTLAGTYTFEIVLYETSNLVRFQYQSVGDRTSSTIGIESIGGTGGIELYENNIPALPDLTAYDILFTPGLPPPSPNCASPTPLTCGVPVSGNTAGAGLANGATAYSCGVDRYDGNEQVFSFTLATPAVVELSLSGFGSRELDAFILSACSPCACVAGGSDHLKTGLDAGSYLVVVDGFAAGDNGPFTLALACVTCVDPGAHGRWTSCENPRSPITTDTTSAFEWNFDDCDYCRDAGNGCFTTACTFDMYIVAECGGEMHMPLYDNETGRLKIYDMTRAQYVPLFAQSTGGWTSSGLEISWQDCDGLDPRWNDQTTDIWFYGAPTLCGIYRAEFYDWGGFIWDLFSNCSGTDTPGFRVYDNYCEALAAYDPFPSLSLESLTITGSCPTYTVSYQISNAGCAAANTSVVASSDLGGTAEVSVDNILPGETRSGSFSLSVQNGGTGTITAYADFYDSVFECQEAGDNAAACSLLGGSGSITVPVVCGCVIPQFSNAQVEDLTCPVGLRINWDPATFASGSGHYDVYRSGVSFADAVAQPPLASLLAAPPFTDNAVTAGSTYYYVIRAEDSGAAVPPCTAGPHGGLFTDVNVGPIVNNLSQSQDKPYDIGEDLRGSRNPDGSAHLFWPTVVPHANTTHWHVYRSANPAAPFPDGWAMICPDKPDAGWLPPATLSYDDLTATGSFYVYDVRSANDCEDICPGPMSARFTSTSPSCDGSGLVSFTAAVTGGLAPFTYDWDFGDGSPHGSGATPSHSFSAPPSARTVTLTVTDSTNPTNQVGTHAAPVGYGPAVTATFSNSPAGLTVTFDGSAGGGTGNFSYSWRFGDNTASSQADPVHTYAAQGSYTVTLTVTDTESGCQATHSATVSL
jgi:PKD repeat protein